MATVSYIKNNICKRCGMLSSESVIAQIPDGHQICLKCFLLNKNKRYFVIRKMIKFFNKLKIEFNSISNRLENKNE